MHQGLNKNERELVRLTRYFIKRAEGLVEEGKLDAEQKEKIVTSCETLQNSLDLHATYREAVIANREKLAKSVKDDAKCPSCSNGNNLKIVGISKHEEGWKSNRYRCRKCNIEFTWNRPNNPWDMIPFIESIITEAQQKLDSDNVTEEQKQAYLTTLNQMQANLNHIKPVLEVSDNETIEMEEREKEMARTVHEFKSYLMIEKIRMEEPPV